MQLQSPPRWHCRFRTFAFNTEIDGKTFSLNDNKRLYTCIYAQWGQTRTTAKMARVKLATDVTNYSLSYNASERKTLYPLDVVGEPLVKVLHVWALLIPCIFDRVDVGGGHLNVLSRVERGSIASRAHLDRTGDRLAAGSSLLRSERGAASTRDDEAVRRNAVGDVVRLRRAGALVARLHVCRRFQLSSARCGSRSRAGSEARVIGDVGDFTRFAARSTDSLTRAPRRREGMRRRNRRSISRCGWPTPVNRIPPGR